MFINTLFWTPGTLKTLNVVVRVYSNVHKSSLSLDIYDMLFLSSYYFQVIVRYSASSLPLSAMSVSS